MKSVRITTSLTEDQHQKLQKLAEKNSLSLAWLIRQAVNEFLEKVESPETYNPLAKNASPDNR